MAMKPFTDSRSRLRRALFHHAELMRTWNEIPNEELFAPSAKMDPSGLGTLRLTRVKPIPDEFSLRFGEMLYQLRSALDATVYQAAIYVSGNAIPPDEGKLEFPILPNNAGFVAAAKRRLSSLPQAVVDLMEKAQPYHADSLSPKDMVKSPSRSLGLLSELARKDRHRKLHVVGSWALEIDPQFILPLGVTVTHLEVMKSGILEGDNELAKFQLSGYVRGMHVQVNPYLATTVGLDEPPPRCHHIDTFTERLVQITNAVDWIIGVFESHF
jgi:hypothetical protein